jgi:hypothetical protein
MPPEPPVVGRPGSIFYQLLRPEFVRNLSKPLCADAFSAFSLHDPAATRYCNDVQEATNLLIGTNMLPENSRDRFCPTTNGSSMK